MSKLKKPLQKRYMFSFVLKFSSIIIAGFSIFGLLTIVFLDKKIGPSYLEGVSALSQIQGHLPSVIFKSAIIQALALCLITVLLALLWSHGISGPILRFRKHLKAIAGGKVLEEPVVFRDTDQLHALAGAFSEVIITYKDNSVKAQALLLQAQKILEECKTLEDYNSHEFNMKVKKLKETYLAIKDIYNA